MKLENGRPENTKGRLEKEIRVYDLLDKLGVEYQRVDHEAAMTMEPVKRSTEHLEMELQSARTCSFATGRKQTFICF